MDRVSCLDPHKERKKGIKMKKEKKGKKEEGLVQQTQLSRDQELQNMYAEDAKENLANVRDSFFKISIQGGRYKVEGVVIGEDGVRFSAIILKDIPINIWYEKTFDPAETSPPDCWSLGGIKPEPGCSKIQSQLCASCPRNRWGSGVNSDGTPSRGKACSNLRRLVLKVEGVDFPVLLHLPPTSVKSFNQYLKMLCTNNPPLPVFAVLSEFGFDAAVAYPKPMVKIKEKLSYEEYLFIRTYRQEQVVESARRAYMDYASEELEGKEESTETDI